MPGPAAGRQRLACSQLLPAWGCAGTRARRMNADATTPQSGVDMVRRVRGSRRSTRAPGTPDHSRPPAGGGRTGRRPPGRHDGRPTPRSHVHRCRVRARGRVRGAVGAAAGRAPTFDRTIARHPHRPADLQPGRSREHPREAAGRWTARAWRARVREARRNNDAAARRVAGVRRRCPAGAAPGSGHTTRETRFHPVVGVRIPLGGGTRSIAGVRASVLRRVWALSYHRGPAPPRMPRLGFRRPESR